jgi:hypothetical protein
MRNRGRAIYVTPFLHSGNHWLAAARDTGIALSNGQEVSGGPPGPGPRWPPFYGQDGRYAENAGAIFGVCIYVRYPKKRSLLRFK